MKRKLGAFLAVGGLLTALATADPAVAQKSGGILKMYWTSRRLVGLGPDQMSTRVFWASKCLNQNRHRLCYASTNILMRSCVEAM